MMNASTINAFGISAMIFGSTGVAATALAYREALSIKTYPIGKHVIPTMIFLLAINVFIIGMGAWVTMLDHAVMGGTRG